MNSPNSKYQHIEIRVDQQYLNQQQAAHYLGISPRHLRRLCQNGEIPSYHLGSVRRYAKNDLDVIMKRSRVIYSNRKRKSK